MLPSEARRRLVAQQHRRLEQVSSRRLVPSLPTSRGSWATVVIDAGLRASLKTLDSEVLDLVGANAELLSEAAAIVQRSWRLVNAIEGMAEDLAYLDAFEPAGGHGATLSDALISAGIAALDSVPGDVSANEVHGHLATVHARANQIFAIENEFAFPEDPCSVAFGVPYSDLLDSSGIFSPSRLLSAYYGRYGELAGRLNAVLRIVAPAGLSVLDAIAPAEALVLTPRPLVSLRTALRTRDLILAKLEADADGVAGPLLDLQEGVDRSEASHRAMVRVLSQLKGADTRADRAVLSLDLYRRMAEGQLKPWAWALLRINGRSGRTPEIASLREQLVADQLPILLDAAAAIIPAARNASAHEDYVWDEVGGVLRIGHDVVSIGDLERASDHAYSFMAGAECGWKCARVASPTLARLLDADGAPNGLAAINKATAIVHFGTNGLHVERWKLDARVLSVYLDALPEAGINPCFQAAMWASRHLRNVDRIVVMLPERPLPAMDLPRAALDATFLVWKDAVAHFRVMPVSTFLPANVWARLAVELPDQAAGSGAWLALNDAVHAYDEAHEATGSVAERVTPLIIRLELVSTALAATIATLPEPAVSSLREALDVVISAAGSSKAAGDGGSLLAASIGESRLRALYESLPTPSVLPTVDPSPIG